MANILKLLEERPQFHSTAGAGLKWKKSSIVVEPKRMVMYVEHSSFSAQWQPQNISVIPMGKISLTYSRVLVPVAE